MGRPNKQIQLVCCDNFFSTPTNHIENNFWFKFTEKTGFFSILPVLFNNNINMDNNDHFQLKGWELTKLLRQICNL